MKISYTILTTPRKEPYLERTIKSLELTGFFQDPENLPLRLVTNTPESDYIDAYKKDARFYVEEMTRRELSERLWRAAGDALRETWGHYRCLDPDRANPDSTGIVVLEDDLQFSKDWIKSLREIVEGLHGINGRRLLLTLYSPNTREPLEAHQAGRKWVSRPYSGFYGPQAIYYPLGVRDEYMAYLTGHPIDAPHDLALGEVMKALRIPMFTSAPCLVQHMEVAPENGSVHRSESFIG